MFAISKNKQPLKQVREFHTSMRNSSSAVRCWNSRPHDKTPAVGETWLFGESVMSSHLIDFTVYYRWTFINVSTYNLGQNQGWENGAFWFLRGFILDLGRGEGGLLFHFILSKIVVWRRLVDATGDSKSLLPEAYLLILEKLASIHCFNHSSKLSVVNTFSCFCSSLRPRYFVSTLNLHTSEIRSLQNFDW